MHVLIEASLKRPHSCACEAPAANERRLDRILSREKARDSSSELVYPRLPPFLSSILLHSSVIALQDGYFTPARKPLLGFLFLFCFFLSTTFLIFTRKLKPFLAPLFGLFHPALKGMPTSLRLN